ncbi:hypothetical protein ABN763_07045 [Spongiivirga sp. MCCC 1A20706]|uniref:hypothetical protein n=1 Tax=Spongiivirga sp. MCCC 1A20706 TaxID=3160963 RepID=UPI003977B7D3
MKYLILTVTLFFLTASCKNKTEQSDTTKEPTQMQRVMAVHDEVMPKMGEIGNLINNLKEKQDSTNTQAYEKAIEDLQNGHDAMMTWMQDFGERFDYEESMKGKPLTEQKKEWLNEEEEKVKIMRDKVINSIKNAEQLLDN